MTLTVHTLFLLIAILCFVLAALNVAVRKINLLAIGLAFFAAAFLVP